MSFTSFGSVGSFGSGGSGGGFGGFGLFPTMAAAGLGGYFLGKRMNRRKNQDWQQQAPMTVYAQPQYYPPVSYGPYAPYPPYPPPPPPYAPYPPQYGPTPYPTQGAPPSPWMYNTQQGQGQGGYNYAQHQANAYPQAQYAQPGHGDPSKPPSGAGAGQTPVNYYQFPADEVKITAPPERKRKCFRCILCGRHKDKKG